MTPELREALHILTRVHTRDAEGMRFVITLGVTPNDAFVSTNEYVEAWAVVRRSLGMDR